MIESPLNYTGGKFRLLPQILPYFPNDIEQMIDIFCGGCNVGVNISAKKVIFNDINSTIIHLFNLLKQRDLDYSLKKINKIIIKYKLSVSSEMGYEFYGCNSSDGLGKYNSKYFNSLKSDFNSRKKKDETYYYMFYVLVVYAFNNQIRFNSKNEYNLPVGKRDFNLRMKNKLIEFINRIKAIDCIFTNQNFNKFSLDSLNVNDFIYADPPYLITCASYNENDGWNEKKEQDLLSFLDLADKRGIKFALSNVLTSKGKTNNLLKEWIEKNKEKYTVIHLNFNYSNSNYHIKDKSSKADEILIINY